jgi:hypothetical protein
VSLFFDATTHSISVATEHGPAPVVSGTSATLPSGVTSLTWAFATGECGAERWGKGIDAQALANSNVAAFNAAGLSYVIATGGEAGTFTCGSDDGMERFIARYKSPRMVGIDFDIERKQSAAVIESLVERVRVAQRRHPELRFSFTLATHAASDGSLRSLNETGHHVVRALKKIGVRDYVINLMVMNYGTADARYCVVSAGACDMGKSAIQAALNVQRKYGIPLHRIELTAMLGINDVTSNVFSLEDAATMLRFVRERALAGAHFWSLDRDGPCADFSRSVSPTCSGLSEGKFAYTRAYVKSLE